MNTEIGKQYENDICEPCKENIAKEMSKLTWKDKLKPQRLAKKSKHWICYECRKKIADKMRRG